MKHFPALLSAAVVLPFAGCGLASGDAGAAERAERIYDLEYVVTLDPAAGGAFVELTLEQDDDYLRELDMSLLGGRLSDVAGDGEVSVEDGSAVWRPPEDGGQLRWFASLRHLRDDDEYDAYITDDWALFRAEDIIPSADTRTLKRARSNTWLEFRMPRGWSSVTPYFGKDDRYEIDNPERRFDTPTGWIVLGDLGVRYDTVSGIRTKVAGPVGQDVRRMDMLALLRWTLPELLRILPEFPHRLTVVSAGDPMWRGALSAPRSLYLHADRPLISENGTSTLLHEVVHVGLGVGAERGADWVVEGLAEYYSLEMLRRSGTIGRRRHERAREDLAEWGRGVEDLCTRHSSGSRTARAVTVLARVDAEIRDKSDGRGSLDDVLRALAKSGRNVTVAALREAAARVAGEPVEALEDLPGCEADANP
ncbi:MAG TPA: hypothetical protein VF200_09805 [Woeseiaceae bacterium]